MQPRRRLDFEDHAFYGPWGALTSERRPRARDARLARAAVRERAPSARRSTRRPGRASASASATSCSPAWAAWAAAWRSTSCWSRWTASTSRRSCASASTNRINTLLDAIYIVPREIGKRSLRLPPPQAALRADLLHRRDQRADRARSTRRSSGRAAWAATSGSARRPRTTARTSSTSTSRKVDHDPDLDTDRRRDELARITNGYSPAMIEQVCSMALTLRALRRAAPVFGWHDIVEAMTTIESGTASGHRLRRPRRRARSPSTRPATRSPRTSTCRTCSRPACRSASAAARSATTRRSRRRSASRAGATRRSASSSGRSARWRPSTSSTARTRRGVGGDVQSATTRAAWMVGMCGMGPEPIDLDGRGSPSEEARGGRARSSWSASSASATQIMNRARGAARAGRPDRLRARRPGQAQAAAQILGQAYMTAVCLMRHNREAGRADRRHARRAQGAARRRGRRAARRGDARGAADRHHRRDASGRSCERRRRKRRA